MMKTITLFLLSFAVACGGAVADIDGGADASKDTGSDGGCTDCFDGGGFFCGKSMCSGTEICIHGCCGGAMACMPLEDGGTCPAGMQLTQQCPADSPCTYTCTPPEPYCGTVKDCSMVQGHDCYLLCQ